MDYIRIQSEHFEDLVHLQKSYKEEIGEATPTTEELDSLKNVVR